VATPGGAQQPAAPLVTHVQAPVAQVAPANPVPTNEELAPKQPPVTVVQVGPANAGSNTAGAGASGAGDHGASSAKAQAGSARPPEQVAVANGNSSNDSNETAGPRDVQVGPSGGATAGGNSTLEHVARTFNEEIVPAGSGSNSHQQLGGNGNEKPGTVTSNTPPVKGKTYVAESGDSVSRMAAKFLGGNTTVNRNAIIKANPSLQGDPNKVIVGRKYISPTAEEAKAAVVASDATKEKPPAEKPPVVVVADKSATPTSSPEYTYTVKAGDNLTKIAVEQLGTAAAVPSIMELNKITDANKIFANMKLRLPAKPIASAQ
jgi:nucleoid-associated protein YgaU